jgi:hypothetical protein
MELACKPKKLAQVTTPLNSVRFSNLGRDNCHNLMYFGIPTQLIINCELLHVFPFTSVLIHYSLPSAPSTIYNLS